MPNAFLPPKVFANAGLKLLKNSLVMAKLCDSEGVDKEFGKGASATVYVKRPPEFTVRDGATASPQDVTEGEVAVTVDKQKGVDVQFTSMQETFDVDQLLRSRVLGGAMAQLASQIDMDLAARINEFHAWVGTPGSLVNTPAKFYAAPQRMDEMAIPQDARVAVMTPADGWGMVGGITALTAQHKEARDALTKAKIPMLGNVDAYMTQTLPALTTGSRTTSGAALVNGASQAVTYAAVKSSYAQTLSVDTLGASQTVKAGDVFTIAGVNAVNPRTKADLGYLQQFVVLADATATGGGAIAALSISPAIIATGAYQNVTAGPADNAAITFLGAASTTYRPNAAFHKTAIKLVSAKLARPYSGECEFATDKDTGLTIRYWRYSNGDADTHNHRFDVVYGTINADRRLGVRFSG